MRAKEAKAMKDLEQKMKEEREEKMEYWVSPVKANDGGLLVAYYMC